jgi:hypothetical protein
MIRNMQLLLILLVIIAVAACNAKSGGSLKGGSTSATEAPVDKPDSGKSDDEFRREKEKGRKIEGAAGASDYGTADVTTKKDSGRDGRKAVSETDRDRQSL